MVTLPTGLPYTGWPSVQLTPPLYSSGYADFLAANSAYQSLSNFHNNYYFSHPRTYYPVQNPYINYDDHVAKASHKEISVERIVKPKSEEKNKKDKEVKDMLRLIALAQHNENQKQRGTQKYKEKSRPLQPTIKSEINNTISDESKQNRINSKRRMIQRNKNKDTEKLNDTKLKNNQETENKKDIYNLIETFDTKSELNITKPGNSIRPEKFQRPIKRPDPNAAFFAPYKNNPLFTYLKGKHTLDTSKLIQFKYGTSKADKKDTVTLILKPIARAVAGLEGKAMATPLSRAVVERGTNADILFEPDAFAIVGPGGIAHAQSELEIGYID